MPEFIYRNQLLANKGRAFTCDAVRPSAAQRLLYQRKLDRFITALHESVVYWLKANWRKQSKLAQDETSAQVLQRIFSGLGRRWNKQFLELAPALAEYMAGNTNKRVSNSLKEALRKGGISVEFVMSAKVREAYHAVVAENVSLIKSIPQEYLGKVQASVMRSVAAGRDLSSLTKDIENIYGVTRHRAAFIARDQNNKATAIITRARQIELGIAQAKWQHSTAGNKPRPSHVAMSGKLYDVDKGMWDEHEQQFVFPGQLPNCRCVSMPVIPGF